MGSLNTRALAGLAFLHLVMALLLFGFAGTFAYWQAWAYLATDLAATLALTIDLMYRDPGLLARRVTGGPTAEREPAQRRIMWLASAGFAGLIAIPGLDRRLAWSHIPPALVIAGDTLVLLGLFVVHLVYRENSFGSAIIEVVPEQTIISTGPYARVRHPMYTGGLLMMAGIPLALASWWAYVAMAMLIPAIVLRLLAEETFLAANLPGYVVYLDKVHHRLIPLVW